MSVTVVNDWCFLKDADLDEGMAAIREYMAYLNENEPELEQSLWLKTNDNPLRYFHIATYKTQEALDRQINSEGTKQFVKRLYPLIDSNTVSRPAGKSPGPNFMRTGSRTGKSPRYGRKPISWASWFSWGQ